MTSVLLIGGMGSGKTTLAEAMIQEGGCNYLYSSNYAVRIPMWLMEYANPDLLSMNKRDYIDTVVANANMQTGNFDREDMDAFGQRIADIYGPTIIGEVVYSAIENSKRYVVDSVPKKANVKYLKDRGLYVVGLDCSEETQVERRRKDKKSIDPDGESLEEQVRLTNNYFEIPEILDYAHTVYNTDRIKKSDFPDIAKEVLQNAR